MQPTAAGGEFSVQIIGSNERVVLHEREGERSRSHGDRWVPTREVVATDIIIPPIVKPKSKS